ncbi:tryptophan synthase subunit alpha [Candidatus Omnitrophus magneticus]|uniref:Tryptophan synthase alpha chain n=1 Tax=Candidatus Omnitrophus magneticus TaxID=1609969 RepID=A0A0F0CSJ7_9BACT|nr:tryptophan synthase subunit alpha [Candidatus Omnitrophus magneticus]
MNRIDKKFEVLRSSGEKAFIPYITAGDPSIAVTKKLVKILAENGADIIELGIPFSDPLADGPTIQKAVKRALDGGCRVKAILAMVKELSKEIDTPLVFMTYFNIVFNYGLAKFIKDAKESGASGIIIPDMPMEESEELLEITNKENFSLIFLAAPTTPLERFKKIAEKTKGFIYYVSLTGVTGARNVLSAKIESDIARLKKVAKKPVCVGFGISTPLQARELAKSADGIIVGSALINIIEKNISDETKLFFEFKKLVKSLSLAVHGK